MEPNREGICGNFLIFDYRSFTKNESQTRPGTSHEIQNLERFAGLLSLKPHVFLDLTKRELQKTLAYIANPPKYRPNFISVDIWNARIKPDHKMIFVAVISHGNADSFLTTDGELFRDTDFDSYLNEDRCHLMRGKPKIIFLNKCRTKGDSHESLTFDFDAMEGDENSFNDSSTSSNSLYIYSCSMGTPSLSSTDTGSLIISALPKEYEKYGRGKEFRKFWQIFRLQMIKEVNMKIQDIPKFATMTQCITTERDSLLGDIYFPQTGLMTASDCLEEMEVEPSLDLNIHKASCGILNASVVEEKPKSNRLKFLRRVKTPRILRPHGQKKDRLKWLLRH